MSKAMDHTHMLEPPLDSADSSATLNIPEPST